MKQAFTFCLFVLLSIFAGPQIMAQSIGEDPLKDFTNYYYTGTGSLAETQNWGSNTDGSGANPADFVSDNQRFILTNTDAIALTESWTVSGENSVVVAGNGTDAITFTVSQEWDATVGAQNNAVLQLENATIPAFGTFEEGSTVIFTQDATNIPYHHYHHLTFDDIDPVFTDDGEIHVSGDFTLSGNVNMPDARDENEYDFIYHGSADQVISGNGNVVRAYNVDILKESGSLQFSDANQGTTMSSDNQFTFEMGTDAFFSDNGQTIYAGNSVNIGGDGDSYLFAGTLILADTEEGIVKGSGPDNNFNVREGNNDNPVASLNNIIVRVPYDDVQFRFRDGTTNVFTIKGDFVVEAAVEGRIRFYENNVKVGGHFIVEDDFGGTIDMIERLTFNGSETQHYQTSIGGFAIKALTINKAESNAVLFSSLGITEELELLSGNLETTQENGLFLLPTASVAASGENSFIDGPLHRQKLGTEPSTIHFPIGKENMYRPMELNVTQQSDSPGMYMAEVFTQDLPELTLPDELELIYDSWFYQLTIVESADLSDASITIHFDENDEFNEEFLTIAKSHDGEWTPIGGIISNGEITSATPFTTDGYFALAELKAGSDVEKLHISAINGGEPVYAGEPFSMQVLAVDGDDIPAEADEDIAITLTLENGTGTLSGTITGVIAGGTTTTTISGIIYDTAEENVSIKAEAEGLQSGISAPFEVLLRTFTLTLQANIAGAGALSGEGEYEEGDDVTIEAIAHDGFTFVNWSLDGEEWATDAIHTFSMPATDMHIVANFSAELPGDYELMYYWHFNTMDGEEVASVETDYSAPGLPAGVITYPGEGDGYMDGRTHRPQDPVSNFNLRLGEEPDQGAVLRVRNPANTRELIFDAPSTGYQNLLVTYATTRTDNGATHQRFEYTTDGENWEIAMDDIEVPYIGDDEDAGQYAHVTIDLSSVTAVNDHSGLQFRIMATGEGDDNTSGNQRFDNFTVDGTPILGDVAESLHIVEINEGEPVYAHEPFGLVVMAVDSEGLPAEVENDVPITLSIENGTGTLSGNITATLAAGHTTLSIDGLLYDTAEEGVRIRAEAEGLEAGISVPFEVLLRTFTLTLEANIAGAGELFGEGAYQAGEEVTIEAVAHEGYEFTDWMLAGDEFSSNAEHTFHMPAQDLIITAIFEEAFTGDPVLVHYWHFNTLDGDEVEEVEADYSAGGLSAVITYPGEGDGYMDARTHRESDPVSNFNLRLGQEPDQGAVLRVRNPADTRELIFQAPSTGFVNLEVAFATTRTENGGQEQRFEFSPDNGETWIQPTPDYEVPFLEDEEGIYLHKSIDLTEYEEVNDNPGLLFRILSVGEGNDNESGNQRFDNFSVDGIPLDDNGGTGISEVINSSHPITLSPNPASQNVTVSGIIPASVISVYNISGVMVLQQKSNRETLDVNISQLPKGMYIIRSIHPQTGKSSTTRLIVK